MFSDPQKNIAELGIGDGMKVVDIGAGSGFYTIEAAKKAGPRGRVYVVDIQQDLLDKIKKSASLAGIGNIEAIWGDVGKIGGTKLRESIADRVIFSNVLFQIPKEEQDHAVLEVKRILKPGGKILIVDWSDSSNIAPKEAVPELLAEGLFQKSGFVLEKSFDAGDHHYGIIFKRV